MMSVLEEYLNKTIKWRFTKRSKSFAARLEFNKQADPQMPAAAHDAQLTSRL